MKLYTNEDGQIVHVDVLLETEEHYYVKRLNKFKQLLPIDKQLVGSTLFETFDEAKEYALKTYEERATMIAEKVDSIEQQTESVEAKLEDLAE